MFVVYLSSDELIEIHRQLIEAFGGTQGLRDRGLLAAACHRPQSGYYDTVYEQAASLMHSLATSHVFFDGNNRIAWTAAKVFLLMNGAHLSATADEAERFIVDEVIVQKADIKTMAAWLESRSKAVPAPKI